MRPDVCHLILKPLLDPGVCSLVQPSTVQIYMALIQVQMDAPLSTFPDDVNPVDALLEAGMMPVRSAAYACLVGHTHCCWLRREWAWQLECWRSDTLVLCCAEQKRMLAECIAPVLVAESGMGKALP